MRILQCRLGAAKIWTNGRNPLKRCCNARSLHVAGILCRKIVGDWNQQKCAACVQVLPERVPLEVLMEGHSSAPGEASAAAARGLLGTPGRLLGGLADVPGAGHLSAAGRVPGLLVKGRGDAVIRADPTAVQRWMADAGVSQRGGLFLTHHVEEHL
jgi:hypothetical protein